MSGDEQMALVGCHSVCVTPMRAGARLNTCGVVPCAASRNQHKGATVGKKEGNLAPGTGRSPSGGTQRAQHANNCSLHSDIAKRKLHKPYKHEISMKSFQGRVVVITDSGSDLGKFLALEFARIGARLALWTQDLALAQQIATQVTQMQARSRAGATLAPHVYEVDLSSNASIQQGAKNVRRDFGQIDVLVNNSDFLHGATLLTASDESIERVLALNTRATIFATQAVLPQMLALNSGVLVNFGTSADSLGTPKLVDYCASKFAVMGFHEALRHELRHEYEAKHKKDKKSNGISMMLVCPTLILAHQGDAGALHEDANAWISSIWMQPDHAAKEIVRAVRRSKAKLVLPPDYSMVLGFLAVLPDRMAAWVRKKLGLSKVMDHFVAPTAGGMAYPSV